MDSDEAVKRRLASVALFISMMNILMGALMSPGAERRYMGWIAPLMVLAFILSRTRFYLFGAALSLTSTFGLMTLFLLFIGVQDMGIIIPLTYFTATVFMASFWLGFRWLVLLAAGQTALVVSVVGSAPSASDIIFKGWMPLNLFVVALILMSRWIQDQNERRLRVYREHLEELVAERSRELEDANQLLAEKFEAERSISANLERALEQKDLLLRELHHRTKNNMQVIASLLRLQSSRTDQAAAKEQLEVARGRIRAMSLVHEKLLSSGALTHVDLGDYLQSLAVDFSRTYSSDRIRFSSDGGPILLSVDKALPLGIVVNELLTNALKYAYPGNPDGPVRMRLERPLKGPVEMEISDDGVGFPPGFDTRTSGGLGYKIVHDIVEKQLGGVFLATSSGGVRAVLRFPAADFVVGVTPEDKPE